MKYYRYAAGFVGKDGGDIKLVTTIRQEALDWTANNKRDKWLSVMRGFSQDDMESGVKYLNSVLVNNVIGFSGAYTEGYKYQLEKEKNVAPVTEGRIIKDYPSNYWDDYYAS